MKRKIIALLFLLMGCTFLNAAPYSEKIKELLVFSFIINNIF